MNKVSFKHHILPHIIAIITFLILTISFFSPIFLENKEIKQHDIIQWQGGAQELEQYRAETGEEGLWTNSMFSGMPGYLISVHYSGELISILHQIYVLGIPHPVNAIFAALLSFYILLLVFGVRPYLAIGGAIAFAFTTFTMVSLEAGHNAKILAIAYVPLILAGIHLAFKNYKLLGFSLTALAMALHLRFNHLQITYYLLLIILIYGLVSLFYAYRKKLTLRFFKITFILVGAVVLALAANAGRILTLMEYSEYSIRGKSELKEADSSPASGGLDREYAFQWSSGIAETMTLLVPGFYGGATQENLGTNSNLGEALSRNNVPPAQIQQVTENAPTYWGNQPSTAGPAYAGAIVIFLFVIGIIFADKKYKYWLASATILSILLSWGKNFEVFNFLMFDYFPGYNKFRAVTMSIYISLLSMPLLGFIGLEKLFQTGLNAKTRKGFFLALGISGGICLLLFLFAGMFSYQGAVDSQLSSYPSWYLSALRADREAMLRGDALRSLIFIALSAGLIWFYLKGKLNSTFAVLGISLFILIDLWMVDKRYLTEENYVRTRSNSVFSPTPADSKILQDQSLSYRVLNLQDPWRDARTSYYHKSIGGYHGAKMRRYQDLIDKCINSEINTLIADLQSGNPNFVDYDVLNMLNTKYFLFGTTSESVIGNPDPLGNAWLVGEIIPVDNPDEEIAATCTMNAKNEAIVDTSKFDISTKNFDTSGKITLENYKPSKLTYHFNSKGKSMAVFSEVYYPEGWTVTIDGQDAKMIRANYVLRALEIPEGEHEIVFEFNPASYTLGNNMMGVASILILLAFLGSIIYSLKVWKKGQLP